MRFSIGDLLSNNFYPAMLLESLCTIARHIGETLTRVSLNFDKRDGCEKSTDTNERLKTSILNE